jgi:tRNA-specific 2-thiouridylase
MKFGFLLERARSLGVSFDVFATGHYARIDRDPASRRWLLRQARDAAKDQSYFLSGLRQEQLARLALPLGAMGKAEVKALAAAAGFPELAGKPESQDFIESRDYGVLFEKGDAAPGDLVDRAGRVLGRHRGVVHYTIGQRKGLGIGGAGEPYYVTGIDAAANRVIVGRHAELFAREFAVAACNWIAFAAAPETPVRVLCKIRQRHAAAPATVVGSAADEVRVAFDEPQMSITPGQTAVFYDGDSVVGSGTIERVRDRDGTDRAG